MNTNHLISFLVLAETQSYQKAAERLHYSSCFFASPKSELATKQNLNLCDLAKANFILTTKSGIYSNHLAHIFKESGIHITPSQYIDSGSLLKEFVKEHESAQVMYFSNTFLTQSLQMPVSQRLCTR